MTKKDRVSGFPTEVALSGAGGSVFRSGLATLADVLRSSCCPEPPPCPRTACPSTTTTGFYYTSPVYVYDYYFYNSLYVDHYTERVPPCTTPRAVFTVEEEEEEEESKTMVVTVTKKRRASSTTTTLPPADTTSQQQHGFCPGGEGGRRRVRPHRHVVGHGRGCAGARGRHHGRGSVRVPQEAPARHEEAPRADAVHLPPLAAPRNLGARSKEPVRVPEMPLIMNWPRGVGGVEFRRQRERVVPNNQPLVYMSSSMGASYGDSENYAAHTEFSCRSGASTATFQDRAPDRG